MEIISTYFIIYSLVIVFYLWFRFIPIIFYKKPNYLLYNQYCTAIIPTYNETLKEVMDTVNSCKKIKQIKQIIVVDDGSKNNTWKLLKKVKDIEFYRLPKNKGKRHAQYKGFTKIKYPIVVTIDSDTTLNKNAIKEITKPFNDSFVGAVTGRVKAKNVNKNLLTRLIGARYNSAFLLERKGQSMFGVVNCCCGSFSAYRKEIINKYMDEYRDQCFLGQPCNFGDDRNLTNIVLRSGYKVIFWEDAIAYTTVPEKFPQFIKQQLRWNQSFVRENLVTMKYMFTRSAYLSIDVLLSGFMPIFSLFARLLMIYFIIAYPITIFFYIATIIILALMRNFLIIENKKQFFYHAIYGFIHTFIIYWLYYFALYKVFIEKNNKWGTR